ncbi:MAG: glycosyltransferase family 39 protein [Planctomycetes bacterium]|nr:glycosyltransferase family 39 protein [Planctomycetota bacterium]
MLRAEGMETEGGARRVELRCAVLALLLIIVAAFWVRVDLIRGSLPYPLHEDERHLTGLGQQIITSGDYLPHWYRYPSPPIYVTAASLVAGFLFASSRQELETVDQIGCLTFPYYEHSSIVLPARLLFALLSVLAMVFSAIIGWRLTGSALVLVLAPLLLSASFTYLGYSWEYLNVDMFGCFFALLAVLYLFRRTDSESPAERCLVPGVLCALTIGSKYNLWPIVVPFLLNLVLRERRFMLRGALFLGTTAVVFLATTPCLFDLSAFLNDVGLEIRHYARGHADFTSESGLAQVMFYLDSLRANFGPVVLVLALIGIARSFFVDWRRAAILLSYPLVLGLYMSAQKVHFIRNVVSMFPFCALFAAVGLVFVARFAAGLLERRWPARAPARRAAACCTILLLCACAFGLSWPALARAYDLSPDSRNLASDWIRAHAAPGSTVFVPEELEMDCRPLQDYDVRAFKLVGRPEDVLRAARSDQRGVYFLAPVEEAESWDELARETEPLIWFGSRRLRSGSHRVLGPGGDPRLAICASR